MFLREFFYVNWGNIPNRCLSFDKINLFSGGNGSGKTTAADAIQTLMTAAHDGLFHFNPGQDESTQRGRGGKTVRTLASYVLGCDDGSYARPDGADGYLAGLFHPTPGESGSPFVAVIGVRAMLDRAGTQTVARQKDIEFFIINTASFSLSELEKDDGNERRVLPLDVAYTRLRQSFGVDKVERYERKGQYLGRLYGALRGKPDAVSDREARRAAQAFSRFMAYKPVSSIDQFVSSEILEAKDLGRAIGDVSSMLKRIHAMDADAKSLRERIGLIASARQSADQFVDAWLQQQQLAYQAARATFLHAQRDYVKAKDEQQQQRAELTQCETKRGDLQTRREQLRQHSIELEGRRQGVAALRDKDTLERDISASQRQLAELATSLGESDQQLKRNARALDTLVRLTQRSSLVLELPQLGEKERLNDMRKIIELTDNLIELPRLLNHDWIDSAPLEQQVQKAQALQSLSDKVLAPLERDGALAENINELLYSRTREAQRNKQKLEQLQAEVDALQSAQVRYPRYVATALKAINQQYPEADARVLCDHVEILDPEWQSAIEGYIGGARFGILVDPEFEARAIQLVRQLPKSEGRARVIQGTKARADAGKTEPGTDSIVALMGFSHATAEAYLRASYDNVRCVTDAEQLRNTRRGLTADGMASGNYAMFRCDMADADLVFGQSARERALLAKREALTRLNAEWRGSADQLAELKQLADAAKQLAPTPYGHALTELAAQQRRIGELEQSLADLDLSEFSDLEEKLQQLRSDEQNVVDNMAELDRTQGGIEQRLKQLAHDIKNRSERQEELLDAADQCEHNLRLHAGKWPSFDVEATLERIDQELSVEAAARYRNEHEALDGELITLLNRLQKQIVEYNRDAGGDALAFEPDFNQDVANFNLVCGTRGQLDSLHNKLNNNILANKSEELARLRTSFNHTFVSHLCHSIYQAVEEGARSLDSLNTELEQHRFGADRERFYFGWEWVAEYRDYWQFFKAVMHNPGLEESDGLFSDELSPKHRQVRDHLMAMLLDDDRERAERELARITDYRHYRRYEIYKQPEGKEPIALSRYGTGSGGQLETPAYIIRAAAITSAFRFSEGDTHLRMVLVDEAFSKMDEHRSREVIRYLTDALGLQLLFIMPTSKSGPFMDIITHQTVFTKCATTDYIGELKSRVLVDSQKLNVDKVGKLWAEHRAEVSHQAALDFMEEFVN
ncbi:SbcC/MukB-like Walker B domain-containing protein [uncultured Gilvimarinus sp.]|uniref:ATP-binding protein n=1 Tax=uncultured Gilvimarinus sp. TaxID=1689143 RepID=UPI0030ED813B